MSPKQRSIIAMFGALIYALFGIRILLSSIPSVWIAARDYAATASGGIGAVSVAVDVIFAPYVLLALASVVVNRMLAGWARQAGGNIKALHRTQRWSIVLALVVAIATVVGFNIGGGPLPFVMLPLSAVMWGLLFVLTGVLLGLYALRTSRT
jgi:hypothetical protein